MTPTLESLATCLQGLVPSVLYTCSKDGVPNAAYLSHVDYVDPRHVALSFQFFNTSRRNIAENPQAVVLVTDPDTGQGWNLRLRFVRSETEGPLFDRMHLRIEAIASYSGLKGIFKLRAADVYEVLGIEADVVQVGTVPEACGTRRAPDPVFTLTALQDFNARIHRAESLDALVDSILEGLDAIYGFGHSMILVPSEEPGVLVTLASRGYAEGGTGAEVRVGEGICGLVAEARKPIRISGVMRGLLYAYAAQGEAGTPGPIRPRIALPGLPNPGSQLGIPLLVRGELVGVLCLESETPYRFHEEDKVAIELLGSYLAVAMQNMQLVESAADAAERAPTTPDAGDGVCPEAPAGTRHDVVFYAAEETVLVDGEYLIRGLPAKILWRVLSERAATGRAEFTNRELRLDRTLNLPEWRDNLESRLLLLRRRLEQKCPDIRLVPLRRGRFAVHVAGELTLVERR
ncbi:MAG: GAF domain-containing protein [Acidobacteriota bacterium]